MKEKRYSYSGKVKVRILLNSEGQDRSLLPGQPAAFWGLVDTAG